MAIRWFPIVVPAQIHLPGTSGKMNLGVIPGPTMFKCKNSSIL